MEECAVGKYADPQRDEKGREHCSREEETRIMDSKPKSSGSCTEKLERQMIDFDALENRLMEKDGRDGRNDSDPNCGGAEGVHRMWRTYNKEGEGSHYPSYILPH